MRVREIQVVYRPAKGKRPKLGNPHAIARLLSRRVQGESRERFYALYLDTRHRLLGIRLVSIGTLNQSLVHPREVFGPALKAHAASVVVAHNHPSGELRPSREDRAVTKRLQDAGDLLGVPLLDHIILGRGGDYLSFSEEGFFERAT